MEDGESNRYIAVRDAEEGSTVGSNPQHATARELSRIALSRHQGQPSPTVKLVAMVFFAVATGVAVFAFSNISRSSQEYVEVWRGGMETESPMEHIPFPEEGRKEEEWQKYLAEHDKPRDPLQVALQQAEEDLARDEQQQAELAEAIRLGTAYPPPPPSPPTMTREDWEKEVAHEAQLKKIAMFHEGRARISNRYWNQGDWYWKYSRDFRTPLENPKMPQCFRNATDRSADFWVPIPVKHTQAKHHLPIYDVPHIDSRKARCFMGKETNEKKGYKIYTCGGNQWKPLLKQRWVGTECMMRPLQDEMLMYLLRAHRVWFFGDYNMASLYNTLKCTMSSYDSKPARLPPGRLTGIRPIQVTFGGQQETALLYAPVGPYQLPAKDRANLGLGKDLSSKYGLGSLLPSDPNGGQGDLVRIHELADIIEENMEQFRPSDIMIINIGNDYSEPRALQASLLKFLRLYEDNDEKLPVVIWQESTAQHHLGFKGGDRLAEHTAPEHVKDPTGLLAEAQIKCGQIPQQELEQGNWRNQLSNRLMEAAGIPVLRIWKVSTEFHDQYTGRCPDGFCPHPSPCRFYCWPGAMPTFMAETLVTLLDSDPLQDVLNSRANLTVPWWQWEPEVPMQNPVLPGPHG